MERDGSGKWSAFELGLICARQNGKGGFLEARALASLFLFDEPLILWSAHQFKTSTEAFRRMVALLQSTPHLDKEVKQYRTSHGEEGIELRNGNRLKFVARSRSSGRGFTGTTVILDEAQVLSVEDVEALIPTMSAVPNPQVIYTGTVALDAGLFRGLRERGIAGKSDSLCYLEWSADDDADVFDRDAWYEANPALGIRISEDFVERELEAMSGNLDGFRRERLSIWPPEIGAARAIPILSWEQVRDDASVPSGGVPLAFGVDASPDLRSVSIAVAGVRQDDRTHVEIVDWQPGSSWVPLRLAELIERHGGTAYLNPRSPIASLLPDIVRAGVDPVLLPAGDVTAACGMFLDSVESSSLRVRSSTELDLAVAAASRRPYGDEGRWKWDRSDWSVDLSPLYAATFAVFAARSAVPSVDLSMSVW